MMPAEGRLAPALIPLCADEVGVWLVDPLDIEPEHHLAILCEQERARADGFRTEALRHDYRCARVLQRLVLSSHAEVDPADWRFAAGSAGRPEIVAPVEATALRFNLSHTAGLVACAVALHLPVGIDVEHLGCLGDVEAVARHVFAPAEIAALLALPEADRAPGFLDIWTLKEACLKATGSGFSASPQAVRFSLGPDRAISAEFDAELAGASRFWQFLSRRLPTGHVLGLAVPKPGPSPCTVLWHQWPA